MNQIQETKAAFEQPEWYLSGRDYNIQLRAEVVRQYLGDRKPKKILDIGCGSGAISVPLLNDQSDLTLVDLSSKMLEIAKGRVAPPLQSRVKTINSGFLEAKLEPKTYDLVICLGVVAYIEDLNHFAEKLTSLVAPGGMLILECSNARHFFSYLTRTYSGLHGIFVPKKVPVILRPSSQVREAIEKCGKRLVSSYEYTLPLPVVQKFFNHTFHYRMIKRIFGFPPATRNALLGNECIFAFV